MTARTIVTQSEQDTIREAAALAVALEAGMILLLSGELGAGKTAFVRGLAKGLGVDPSDVTSPTFTLVHEYGGGRLPLVHIDLYRLEHAELDEIGLDDDLAARGVVAIEWPERLGRKPVGAIVVRIEATGEDRRVIQIA